MWSTIGYWMRNPQPIQRSNLYVEFEVPTIVRATTYITRVTTVPIDARAAFQMPLNFNGWVYTRVQDHGNLLTEQFMEWEHLFGPMEQCSSLKPSYEFHFEGLLNFSFSVEGLVQIIWRALKFQSFSWQVGSNPRHQSMNIEMKYKTELKICAWIMRYMFPGTMWRIKNQPSYSTSCIDNAQRLLVLVPGSVNRGLQVTSSFLIWGCVVEGCFERGIYLEGQIAYEGHWRLQSWTLLGSSHLDSNSKHEKLKWRRCGIIVVP